MIKLKNNKLIILSVWFLLYCWRPFVMGFYSDDYVLLLEPVVKNYELKELWNYCWTNFTNRPFIALFSFICISVLKDSAFLWHLYGGLVTLSTGLALFYVLKVINKDFLDHKFSEAEISLFSSLWISLPIILGITNWPTVFLVSPSILLFLLSFYFLIRHKNFRKFDFFTSLFLYAVSILTYESFYFQFVFFLGMLLINFKRDENRKKLIFYTIGFSVVQVGAVVFSRLAKGGDAKGFDLSFIMTRVMSVLNNPEYLLKVIAPILICFSFLIFLIFNFKKLLNSKKVQLITLTFSCLVLSILTYLIVGYSIRVLGLGSRTAMCLSIMIVFLIVFAFNFLEITKNMRIKIIFGILVINFLANFYFSYDWYNSWKLQKMTLSNLPAQKLKELDNSLVIMVVPNYSGEVVAFEESWTLEKAVKQNVKGLSKNLKIYPHKNDGFRAADVVIDLENGFDYISRLSGHQFDAVKAENYYIWNSYTLEFRKIAPPFEIKAFSDLREL